MRSSFISSQPSDLKFQFVNVSSVPTTITTTNVPLQSSCKHVPFPTQWEATQLGFKIGMNPVSCFISFRMLFRQKLFSTGKLTSYPTHSLQIYSSGSIYYPASSNRREEVNPFRPGGSCVTFVVHPVSCSRSKIAHSTSHHPLLSHGQVLYRMHTSQIIITDLLPSRTLFMTISQALDN